MRRGFWMPGTVVMCVAQTATAQSSEPPPATSFVWSAPRGCPDRASVVARIDRLLGRPLDAAPEHDLAIAARVDHGSTWRMRLAITSPGGATVRTLADASCERLAEATALIVVLAADPNAAERIGDAGDVSSSPPPSNAPDRVTSSSPPPSNASALASGSVASGAPSAAPADVVGAMLDREGLAEVNRTAPAPRMRASPRISIGGGAVTDIGILPGLGVGAELRLGIAFGALHVALRTDFWPERSTPDFGALLRVTLLSLGLQACFVPLRGPIDLRFCGALDAGDMRTPSNPARAGQADDALWMAMFSEAGIGWRASRALSFRLDAGPGVTLATPRFVNMAATTTTAIVFQPSIVAFRAGLFVELFL